MSSKNLLYIVMGLVGLFCFAGIYDAVLTGKLGQVVIDGPPGYNGYVGVVRRVVPLTDVEIGDVVFVTTTTGPGYPYVEKADADASTTVGDILVMVQDATSMGVTLALENGSLSSTGFGFTSPGLPVYVSTTSGLMTETAPDGSGDQVQIIGYTESGNVLRVKPCLHIDAVQ